MGDLRVKRKAEEQKLLTETELEFMNVIWALGEATVNDVIEHLPADRQVAYTSVSTILRILQQKNVLSVRKEGRGHVYIPLLQKSDYESRTLHHIVDKVFDGTPLALVRQLLGTMKMKPEEVHELKELVAKLEKNK
jgi:predicted transcriptional regulator